jgi:DNA-binding transcriptional MocR family regulator
MTGWRCGWTIGPAKMIAASNALQSHATSNVNSITQKAVVEALNGSQAPVKAMLDEYRTRRDNLYNWLTASPHIKCLKPGGAFVRTDLRIRLPEMPSGFQLFVEKNQTRRTADLPQMQPALPHPPGRLRPLHLLRLFEVQLAVKI